MKFQLKNVEVRLRDGGEKKVKDVMSIDIDKESIMDNLVNRHDRPYKDYRKYVIPLVMESIKKNYPEEYGLMDGVKWKWDQYAGCSMCPCSPGFVGGGNRLDIFVTIKIIE